MANQGDLLWAFFNYKRHTILNDQDLNYGQNERIGLFHSERLSEAF